MTSALPIPELRVREVDADDLEEILVHRRRMFQDMRQGDKAALDALVNSSRPVIRRFLEEGTYRVWFAVTPEGRVAAGAGVIIHPWPAGPFSPDRADRAYYLNVYTYPEFRKRGLARLLTQTTIDYCRTQGHKVLWLHASEFGRPIYESLGFRPTNEMKLPIE
jgi:GNAT superfamily N-acetyltransferase